MSRCSPRDPLTCTLRIRVVYNVAVVLIAIGLCCCIGGVLAYTGRWKKWVYSTGFSSCEGFALLFVGLLPISLGIALLFPGGWAAGNDTRLLVSAFAAVFAAVGIIGFLGFLGLWPNFLLPRWFKEERKTWRQAERAARDLRKSARELRKANRKTMTDHNGTKTEVLIDEVETARFIVRYPNLLRVEEVEQGDDVELVLVARDADLPFRPNIVFTSSTSTAPLVDASMAAILAAGEQHPGARLVSVDVFFGSLASADDHPIGRVLTFTYPATRHLDVMVKKWVVATGEYHLHASASFLPSQALVVEETFDWIVTNLRFSANPETVRTAATGASEVGVRLDEDATARAGFPLEDLTVIPAPAPESARPVSVSAIKMLTDAWGVQIEQPKVLHVVVTRSTDQGFYAAYPGPDGLLVMRTSGPSAYALDTDNVEAYGLSPERLPADAAAWMGVVPAFRFSDPWRISHEEYTGRVDGSSNDEPWTEFRIEFENRWWRAVFVPGQGLYEAISPEEGMIELQELPAARFFDLILRRVDSVLGSEAK